MSKLIFFLSGLFNRFPIAAPLIIENLRDAIIVVDARDKITNVNRAAKEAFNIQNHIIGSSVFELLPKAAAFKEQWEAQDARVKVQTESNGQSIWYDTTITHLHKKDGALMGRVIVFHDITQEQSLLEAELHHSKQMALLGEVGRQISNILNERDILQYAVDAVISHFGYAEAAVSLLTADKMLEVITINGTQDFGYKPGYRQKIGEGIIGHTAQIRATYLANNIAQDPYYFSNDESNDGSVLCIPLINEMNLLGVLYIESSQVGAFDSGDVQMLETLASQITSAAQRARLYTEADEHLQTMLAVQFISKIVSSSLELKTIYESVVQGLQALLGYTHISIYILQDEYLLLGAQVGYAKDFALSKIHISQGISRKAIESKEIQFVPDVTQDPHFLRLSAEVASEICVPLIKDDMALGTLNVEATSNAPLTEKDVSTLRRLAGPIALAVDNARLHEQVKILAMTDAVSGLSNRHVFEESLRTEIERATRSSASLTLIIFDIDSFKQYNDTWGHPAGDKRLRAVADIIRQNLRTYDIAARYGGDEFAVILPDTNQQGGKLFARRLLDAARGSIPSAIVMDNSVAGYTLSIGIATFPQDGKTFESLLLAADQAEMTSKRLGKNRAFSVGDTHP